MKRNYANVITSLSSMVEIFCFSEMRMMLLSFSLLKRGCSTRIFPRLLHNNLKVPVPLNCMVRNFLQCASNVFILLYLSQKERRRRRKNTNLGDSHFPKGEQEAKCVHCSSFGSLDFICAHQ